MDKLSSAWLPPTLRTERLVIRPFTATDFAAFRAYAEGQPATEYGSWLGGASPSDAARYLVDTIARYGRPPRTDLGICFEGQLIGGVAFHQVWLSPPTMELGWVLHPAMAGKGLAREANGALLGWLFERFPELSRVEARVRVSDANGVRLLEKLGFIREGSIRHERSGADGALQYGLLRSEWLK
ncbi:MAG: GNAT family protein [Pseudomonadota bacterium]|nr:GNAT family protein [Pseudomonadota bacterium]